MSSGIYLSIVVPAYNEERRIEGCIKEIFRFMRSQDYLYEVIISDDGSSDRTRDIVKKYQRDWPNLILHENIHRGKAVTVISGINRASGKFVLFTDVDLSVSIDETPKLLNWLENQNYDVAIASREGTGAKRINEPNTRHIMGRVFNALVQVAVLPGINDTQCGFKMFRTPVIQEIFKRTKLYSLQDKEIKGGRVSAFDVEILYLAKKLGYKIKEVPVTWVYDGDSKVHNFKDSYYNARDVFQVKFNSLVGKYS